MKHIFRVIFAIVALALIGCEEPYYGSTPDTTIHSLGTPPNNEIWFITSGNRQLDNLDSTAFDSEIIDIEYSDLENNVIRFAESITTIGAGAFDNCRNLVNISLPTSVTTIAEKAFFECTGLECITVGNKLRECGYQAFDNCASLYSLHISSIGDWCGIEFANPTANPLYYCGVLTINDKKVNALFIPDWVSRIGDYAFYNYTVMSSIEIPAKVKSIGKDAFEGCEYLSQVHIKDVAAWSNIEFATASSNPLSIAETLYLNGQPTTTLSIEDTETIAPRAFYGCTSIATLKTDDKLRTIGEEAFRGCISISSVELSSEITEIAGRAFMGCKALSSVACNAVTPPSLGDKYVFDYNADGRKIFVPAESLNTYKEHSDWNRYADSIEAIE